MVVFRTVAAKEEVGSNKATKARFFVLDDEKPWEMADVSTLVVRFQYRELTPREAKGFGIEGGSNAGKQEKINAGVCKTVIEGTKDEKLKGLLQAVYRNDAGLLAYQIARFTAKNTKDYFIHKNLKRFLTEQLDYFIKAEVISLETLEKERFFDKHITRAKVVKEIGERIVDFVAQIEDFQKRLWEKKKFVISTDYVVTTDLVPGEFHAEILKNKAQRKEWKELGFEAATSAEDLKTVKFPIDTRHFEQGFKERLLEKLTEKADLDDLLDGLVIKSENWQGLNLLAEKYREKVKCVYIDPPYNIGKDGFLYRDNLQHSTWLAMIEDRLTMGTMYLVRDGVMIASIDDVELYSLVSALQQTFGRKQVVATLIWDRNRKNDATFFSVGHEYMVLCAKDKEYLEGIGIKLREAKPGVKKAESRFKTLCKRYQNDWGLISEAWSSYTQGLKDYELRSVLAKYPKIGPRGPFRDDGNINWPGPGGPRYQIDHPVTGKRVKMAKSGWRYPTPERFWEEYKKGKIAFGNDETTVPGVIYYLFESSEQVMGSVFWSYAQTAIDEFNSLFDVRVFENPKNWRDIGRLCAYLGGPQDVILDFFAGSGTTAHAVINLNREDLAAGQAGGGRRKYILIEMANYFETVLMPRIKKVVYSDKWKDGKPQTTNGISHFVKYQYLEQYEDSLDNIELKQNGDAEHLFGDDYLLKYFVDFETKDNATLLKVEDLKRPFSYTLKVNAEEVGEPKEVVVDIPETFSYLTGLTLHKVKTRTHKGTKYHFTLGEKEGKGMAVVWREYDDAWTDARFMDDKAFIIEELKEWAPHVVYINGQSVLTPQLGDHPVEIRQIEPEFKALMGG